MKTRTLAALAALLAAACGSVPTGPNPALEAARAAYRAASADPQVLRSAQVELAQAEDNLRRADTAWQKGADPAVVDHLAYLAKQQALIAGERGRLAQARQTIETASAERNRVLLENRNLALARERDRLAMAQRRAQAAEGVAAAQAERAAQLEKELQDLAARQTPIGMVMTLGDVLFDVGQASLKPGAQLSLDRLAEFLKRHPERKVRIEGFTDASGSPEANQELSNRRAGVVRDQLVQRGIAADRVEAVGYGSAFPVASNTSAAGRQQNRRVEIVISDEAGNIATR